MEGQFEAVVEVDEAGRLSSFVWDCEMEEVYTAHLVTASWGFCGAGERKLSVHFGSSRGGLLYRSAIFQGPKQPHSPAHQGEVG